MNHDARPNLGRLACGQIKMLIMLSLAAPSSRYKILNILIREFSRTVDVKLLENTLSFDKFEKYKTVFSKSREVPEKFREQTLQSPPTGISSTSFLGYYPLIPTIYSYRVVHTSEGICALIAHSVAALTRSLTTSGSRRLRLSLKACPHLLKERSTGAELSM